ncbi:hypothetical protein BTR23_13775 [Alkalihalophilus pseudofirmus]|nr:hypothetical protein BTR23_13775 [Alkalihalophilus pseudofirmus]
MGMPNFGCICICVDSDREGIIDLLLASIAMEELSLAHIMNAEGEKIQSVLGTNVDGFNIPEEEFGMDALICVNRSAQRMLQTTIKKEMLLQFKLENIIDNLILPNNNNGEI